MYRDQKSPLFVVRFGFTPCMMFYGLVMTFDIPPVLVPFALILSVGSFRTPLY